MKIITRLCSHELLPVFFTWVFNDFFRLLYALDARRYQVKTNFRLPLISSISLQLLEQALCSKSPYGLNLLPLRK